MKVLISKARWALIGAWLILPQAARADQAAAHDARLTSISELLAGREPEAKGFERWTSTDAWKKYQATVSDQWSKILSDRHLPAAQWRDKELAYDTSRITTLNYPFSGPDLVNALLFFPKCRDYVFYSLEAPGRLPNFDSLTEAEFQSTLEEIQDTLSDIFYRHYFITKKMMDQLRQPVLDGNLPIFFVMIGLMQGEIVGVEYVQINAEGKVEPAPKYFRGAYSPKAPSHPVPGVKVVFRMKDAPAPQTLYYYSLDVSDTKIVNHPEFLKYLESLAPTATFLKSASYLLHNPKEFMEIRKNVMAVTEFVMQDDSGLPYFLLKNDQWSVTLYGKYTKTIKDFGDTIQKDLDDAYKSQPERLLPFNFGYHWWDGHSVVQVARRKTPLAPAVIPAQNSAPAKTP